MSQFLNESNSYKREVNESSIDYLIGEILFLDYLSDSNDQNSKNIQRLENIGHDIGYRLIEKVAMNHKFIGSEPLDVIKFICKEFWEELFKKKVDKLRTNHRGIYVLTDSKFKWLDKYTSDDINSKQTATKLLHIPCGILRGALANLGISAVVTAELNNLPSCTFNIRIKS